MAFPVLLRGYVFSIFLHDFADIFLETAKLCLYARNNLYYFFYFCLIPAWGIPRVAIYPITSVLCGITDFKRARSFGKNELDIPGGLGNNLNFLFNMSMSSKLGVDIITLLGIIIYIMDVIWFYMILRMMVRALLGRLNGDIRSEEEEARKGTDEEETRNVEDAKQKDTVPSKTVSDNGLATSTSMIAMVASLVVAAAESNHNNKSLERKSNA